MGRIRPSETTRARKAGRVHRQEFHVAVDDKFERDDATAPLALLADWSLEPGRQMARQFAAHAPTPLGRNCRTSN